MEGSAALAEGTVSSLTDPKTPYSDREAGGAGTRAEAAPPSAVSAAAVAARTAILALLLAFLTRYLLREIPLTNASPAPGTSTIPGRAISHRATLPGTEARVIAQTGDIRLAHMGDSRMRRIVLRGGREGDWALAVIRHPLSQVS